MRFDSWLLSFMSVVASDPALPPLEDKWHL